MGLADYKNNTIWIDKKLSKKEKEATLYHEKAHFKLRKLKFKTFSKAVLKELKSSGIYKSAWAKEKKHYTKEKFPEEMFCESYCKFMTSQIDKEKWIMWGQKYPKTFKAFNTLMRKI
jgi:hypothetical protein